MVRVANSTPVEMQLSPVLTSYQLLQPEAAPGKGVDDVEDSTGVTGVASTGATASGTADGTTIAEGVGVDEAMGADEAMGVDETMGVGEAMGVDEAMGVAVAVGVVDSTGSEGIYVALPVIDAIVDSLHVDPPSTHPRSLLAMSDT